MSIDTVPTAKDLLVIMDQVWASYLDPDGLDPLVPVDEGTVTSDIRAWVEITGSWEGHVLVTCSWAQARNLAAAFLGMGVDEVPAEEDVADVLGEMANIVGGNVKSMLPSGSTLSTPSFVDQGDGPVPAPGVVLVAELVGEWRNESLSVGMWQSRSEGMGVAA
jgi:chemotaxis protein CheX